MTGAIKFELDFEVDNNWEDAYETIIHIKQIVSQELKRLEMQGKFGEGVCFDGIFEDWNDLEFKTDDDRRMDYLMATDPRV
jgi:hypothetical protein